MNATRSLSVPVLRPDYAAFNLQDRVGHTLSAPASCTLELDA